MRGRMELQRFGFLLARGARVGQSVRYVVVGRLMVAVHWMHR